MKLSQIILTCSILILAFPAFPQEANQSQDNESTAAEDQGSIEESDNGNEAQIEENDTSAREAEAALNEDPEAQMRSKMEEQPHLRDTWPKIDFYGSLRLHAIHHFDEITGVSELAIGDGASRIGVRGEWEFIDEWWLFGRAETGFDVLETFTAKGTGEEDSSGLEERLIYGGISSENLSATWGKNWSAYYKTAGMADRFSIFGGQAVGIYNAGTDGGATGTGRADDVLQVRLYTSSLKALRIKPFNLNLQYQKGQPIPHVKGRHYGQAWGASVWLENQNDVGIGIAIQHAEIEDVTDPLIEAAGITGNALAIATSFRFFGDHWYSALVLSRLENVATTNTFKYINGYGAELYAQWEFKDRWWMVAGGNWLEPDEEDEDAGEYNIRYGVLGLRYTFDSFKRMLYAEYRLNYGKLEDGTPRENVITFGVRWDFGY